MKVIEKKGRESVHTWTLDLATGRTEEKGVNKAGMAGLPSEWNSGDMV